MPERRARLPTTLVTVQPETMGAEALAKQLRLGGTPIFARVRNDQVLLDPRTLRAGDDEIIVTSVAEALNTGDSV